MRAQPQVPSLCIDETSLRCGELYTVEMIHVSKRKTAKEVTLDLLPTMMRIV